MARKPKASKQVETFTHEDATRPNIPTAEYQSVMKREEQDPVRVAYERRNRDLDPQLVWRGKDEQDWSDLVVHAPPLYIQEKVHPKVLVDDLMRRTEADEKAADPQPDLFADFNGLSGEAASTEFYQHDANWTNRMVLGDSLQVMASLAEREGLRGKVQCIYLDPPYGIKFNSNFQWSTTSRDVKDGKADHITREPEQVKAFRDTWRDGIHSYLTYLRDRLTVARDLLADSGSIFVQIGDENVHRVRALMDEVFGEDNFISQIQFKKSGYASSNYLSNLFDIVLWYGKTDSPKYRELYRFRGLEECDPQFFDTVEVEIGYRRQLNKTEKGDLTEIPARSRLLARNPLVSPGPSATSSGPIEFCGKMFPCPPNAHWKTTPERLETLKRADRLIQKGNVLRMVRYLEDNQVIPFSNLWTDTGVGGFVGDERLYVVQTDTRVIQRCIQMTTDPGDLVLDPTCGSGTTAYVAEQWGRRWITADTSRVALALARARIMGARYPYYLLADSREGQVKEAELSGQWAVDSGQKTNHYSPSTSHSVRQGFVYERVPHITLKSIANNAEIDVIWERHEQELALLREQLSVASGQQRTLEEWEIPREKPDHWPQATQPLLTQFWEQRIARQKEIDASIAAKADNEYLYDKPYTDNKKVRVAGPFTVESLSPHRVLGVDEDDELIDTLAEPGTGYGEKQDFPEMVLENLKTSGVQQAHREDRISFTSITPWPGELVSAEGRFAASEQWLVTSDQQEKEPVTSHESPATSYKEPATSHESPATSYKEPATSHESPTTEYRAAIFIGPEFGTVSRPDLVAAAREAGDAGFDALISCAFNYDAHSSEFHKLGRIPVLKARMNADLHMADDLKNTGKGNLFVVFGEPDISVVSGQWLVSSEGRMVAHYDSVRELSGLGSLEEINRLGREDLPCLKQLSGGGEVRTDESGPQGGGLGSGEHRGGSGSDGNEGVPPVSERGERVAGGGGDVSDSGGAAGVSGGGGTGDATGADRGDKPHAGRAQAISAIEALKPTDFPMSLTTNHYTQATVHGVDVFHPNTGEVRSDGAEGIACWFIDTDYNEESFFVRQAYFLGANDPYKSLKTTLKAEINEDAWATLNSDTSRPFDKPDSGRIAVKVINHLGDEVMKVFAVS